MKIAQIVCTFPPYKGGIGNSAYQFARVLSKQGHEVTVFAPDYTSPSTDAKALVARRHSFERRHAGKLTPLLNRIGEFAGENKVQEVKIVRLKPWFKYGNAAFLPQLLWKLKGFDIVHLHYPFFGAAEIIAFRKILFNRNMNLIVHYHMDSIGKGIKGFIFKLYKLFVLPILLRQAKIVTCASLDYVKHSALADYYKNHQKKFRQTFFGVDLEQFVIYHDHKNKERKNKVVLFVGGLDKAHYFKGLENLLKAVYRLQIADCRLQIVGDGDLRKEYEKLAKKLDIDNMVEFVGKVDDDKLVKCYQNADLFVLPSINRNEAFGLVLLEAMACAKPVIASNLPGVRGVFKRGKHGLLVQPDNVDDLANKLKAILSDKNLARKMGQASRELVEKKYTWDKVGKRLDEIYHYVNYTPK
ncbi:glycosyltransferase family 4 protein [Candidatus Parcubacteria bacterium]|nr:glycosyltransferase family 4 protein [Candidatus Parcubacteria bacterium]